MGRQEELTSRATSGRPSQPVAMGAADADSREGRSWPAASHPVLAEIVREQCKRADDAEREFGKTVADVFFKIDLSKGRAAPLGAT